MTTPPKVDEAAGAAELLFELLDPVPVAVVDPCDVEGAFKTFKKIKINIQENSKFIKKYLRSNVSKNMVKSILEVNE